MRKVRSPDPRIDRLDAESADAYMYDNYTRSAWKAGIKYLISLGWSDEAILETLRSKYPRWIDDGFGRGEGKGVPSGRVFCKGLEQNLSGIKDMLKKEFGLENPRSNLGQNPRKPYFIWDKTERQIVATQGDERTDGTRWTKPMLEEFAEDNNYREGGEEWVVTNEDVVDGVDIWGGRGGENPRIVGSRVEEMERVGQTILQQLGGKKFTLMTGAKNFVLGDGYLKFRIGRNSKGVSLVKITLMPSDTYLVEFFKGVTLHSASSAPKLVSRHDDVYADQLSELFARVTGMDTVPPRFGSNPRTVPTRDEMKAKSLGALVLGGEVNLWLIKDSPTFFVFCEDDGDHTQAAGHSQSEALAVAKRLWPNCTFYPSPRQERPGTGRGRGNPLDLKNWWVFAVAGNKPVGILKHRHTTRHPRQHSMVRMAWSTKSRKRGKWMPLDVLVEKSFISDRRQAFEYAQLALAEVQSKAVVG